MLSSGTPPEDIREAGVMAKGLRDCIGGARIGPDGEPTILDDYCIPEISRWPLLPGDFVILCSDGLVEEGAFLDERGLAESVRENSHLPATELAQLLVEKANELQRLPSPLEPEGFGDNITCIVVKVNEASPSDSQPPEKVDDQ